MKFRTRDSRKRVNAEFSPRMYSLILSAVLLSCLAAIAAEATEVPKPPAPEPIEVTELPLPPTAPGSSIGACTVAINPHRTGCIDPAPLSFQSGSFLPGGHHVLALVHFMGAPLPPDAASAYNGGQIIIVKTDGTNFPNGDAWHCVTCDVPAENRVGAGPDQSYPQAFLDGKPVGPVVDTYAPTVVPGEPLTLGKLELTAGRHVLRFLAVGHNPESKGYLMGIDHVIVAR